MRNSFSIPNLFTLLRLFLLPLSLWLFHRQLYFLSLVVFVASMLTDSLDGFLALKLSQKTTLGTFLDPVVDKIVILVFFYELAFAGILPLPVAHLFLARELLQNAVRSFAASKGKVVGANWMGKTKSALQCAVIAGCILVPIAPKVIGESYAPLYRSFFLWASWAVLAVTWAFFFRFAILNGKLLLAQPENK